MKTKQQTEFHEKSTRNVQEAIDSFLNGALPVMPVIDKIRVNSEYKNIQSGWGSRGLKSGTPQEIAAVLRKNLEKDLKYPLFLQFMLTVDTDECCTQAVSIFSPEPGSTIPSCFVYRIWKTSDSIYFCGNEETLL